MQGNDILVVDDDDDMRSTISLALRQAGYRMTTVENCEQAWRTTAALAGTSRPVNSLSGFENANTAIDNYCYLPFILVYLPA